MRSHSLTISLAYPVNPFVTPRAKNGAVTSPLKKTVMICEDDPDLLQVYKLALRSKYNVIGVASGSECLETYKQTMEKGSKIDAMLLDFRLPDYTGEEVAKELKKLDGTRIVMISAYDIDVTLLGSLKISGYITQFVRKPVSVFALGQAIESALSV